MPPRQMLVKSKLMADVDHPRSMINVVCTSLAPRVDCTKGIATAGFSQGGYHALHFAAELNKHNTQWKVTANLGLFTGHVQDAAISPYLPKDRRRLHNSNNDNFYSGNPISYAGYAFRNPLDPPQPAHPCLRSSCLS